MSSVIVRRRFLTNFDPHRLPHLFTDVIVLGSGVAGLSAAIEASQSCDVLLLTKDVATESNTAYAQGGIAAATTEGDSLDLHARDTIEVACGLGHDEVIQTVIGEAPRHIAELADWGAAFDSQGGALSVGREGGHSAARIIHAHGDATGREIARVLIQRARACPRLRIFEKCFAIDLLTSDRRVVGVVTYHPKYGHQMFWAGAVILATGGAGCIYRETTNPRIATGDGVAMAFRAGAVLRDMEMVQFHPTTLYVAGAARALISEAVRGEGGRLVNRDGRAFMGEYHPRAELAPRDIVSRAIAEEMRRERSTNVFLDVRHFAEGVFAQRFPSIDRLCRDFDLDPSKDLIPVRPSAHYMIGGVATDLRCGTSVPGLFACGEAACSGLHGANRLASNSLLEGVVFGPLAGRAAARFAADRARPDRPAEIAHLAPPSARTELDLVDVMHSLRSLMSRNVGLERSSDRLRETLEIIEFWARYVMDKVFDEPAAWETQNALTVAHCIALAAATRTESRGVHFRADYPQSDDSWRKHVDLRRGEDQTQVSTSELPENRERRYG